MSDDLFKSLMSSTPWPTLTVADLLLPTADDQLAPCGGPSSPVSTFDDEDFELVAVVPVPAIGGASCKPVDDPFGPFTAPMGVSVGVPSAYMCKKETRSCSSSEDERMASAAQSYVDACSEEEINRLLSMPPRYCTPEEREIRKKAKNRMAAQESRKRKKARSDVIGGTLSQLKDLNTSYEAQVQSLSATNGRLAREIAYLREVLRAAGTSNPTLARVALGEMLSAEAVAQLAEEEDFCEACSSHEARRKRQRLV